MTGRSWQKRAVHIMLARKQRKGVEEGTREKYSYEEHAPVSYILQLGPTSYLSSPPNNASTL
jgi:hypothetical protein